MVYLSARGIGLYSTTKKHIKNAVQKGINMPDGPLILPPEMIMQCIVREVVV
jgi:phosphatidate phosphatase PAH1